MIGADFQKIQWNMGGLELLEPNAFIGDTLILGVSLYCYLNIRKTTIFHQFWANFYLLFGISFLLGGFGHLLFNYCGLWGKAPSWLFGIVATYYVEQAMLSLWQKTQEKKALMRASKVKMGLFLIVEIVILANVTPNQDPAIGLLIPTVNSILGMGATLGYLGYYYQKKWDINFRCFWIGSLALLPNAAVQGLKINLHPWFDRNDLSHVLLIIGVSIYFVGVRRLYVVTGQLQNAKS